MSYIFVYSTAKDEEEAASIAEHVVNRRLAACANILPQMKSFYRWQGQLQKDLEVVMIFKTKVEAFEALERAIKAMHSYECPCIIALPISEGHKPYLDWININID